MVKTTLKPFSDDEELEILKFEMILEGRLIKCYKCIDGTWPFQECDWCMGTGLILCWSLPGSSTFVYDWGTVKLALRNKIPIEEYSYRARY